jgi:mannose-6-phosphate isomerase-like protein (cupin superfamily)
MESNLHKKEKAVMGISSTLKIFNESEVAGTPGVVGPGQLVKQLVGNAEHPTERLTVSLVTFEAGLHEHLHWHLIEVFYYVISGRAVMNDIEGRSYEVGPGSVIYASPGIAGSHSWDIREKLQLMSVRATAEAEKTIQFDVDPVTRESTMPVERLARRDALSLKKSLY